ncbi:DNA topoisomerase VI subunit B [Candidatus Micrarchaeota archaeon]|nr:DNA topoisomerase VI subunit B [Candidatus Micrarchaeota archaeon]
MTDVFSEFKEHSIAEFFKKNRQMLGFSGKTRSLTTIIHELVTNSLDASEEERILPEIHVKIEELDKEEGRYKIYVNDNGSGIPEKHLGKAMAMMLAGTKFHRFVQQRGQQGIGAAGVTMYAQLTTGKEVHLVSGYKGDKLECDISIDFKTNKPIIKNIKKEKTDWHGLSYEAEVSDVKYDKSTYGVYEYLKRTAIANPHTQILLTEPDGTEQLFPRSIDIIPPKPKEVQPHPLGITTSDLIDFAHHDKDNSTLRQFLQSNFSRLSSSKVQELDEICPDIDFKKAPGKLEWRDAEKLVKAFQEVKWIAPSIEGIHPIGEKQIEKSMINILNPEFIEVVERKPAIFRGGIPFIVEVGLAYGGDAGRAVADRYSNDIMRFANRAPLLFDGGGCAITEAVKNVEWKRYSLRKFDEEPISVLVNISSVHIPYTGAGKQAISNEKEMVEEIRNALMEAARKLKKHLHGKIRDKERKARKKAVEKYVEQLSQDLADLAEYKKPEVLKENLSKLVEEKYIG